MVLSVGAARTPVRERAETLDYLSGIRFRFDAVVPRRFRLYLLTLTCFTAAAPMRVYFVQVKLGLLPGWGGTQLLHPIVGLQAALDMILTGE